MPLSLYRRHQRGCEAPFPVESKTGEFEERKRGWKRCGCFIFATGTLAGKFKRRYTGKTNWDEAKAVAAEWEKAGSWDGEVIVPEPLPQPAQPHRVTVDRAIKAFLAELHETLAFAKWLTSNPARMVKNPRGRDASEKRGEQKLPFTMTS